MSRIEVFHLDDIGDVTPVDLSATAHTKRFMPALSDTGSFSLQLQNTDPLLAAIDYGDFIQFDYDGTPRLTGIVENIDRVVRSEREEVAEVTTIHGRGHAAEWAKAVVYPPNRVQGHPFTTQRVFNFATKELPLTGWSVATEVYTQGTNPPVMSPNGWFGYPIGWPDPSGKFMWSRVLAGNTQPAGSSFFARSISVLANATFSFYVAADDGFRLWVDGVLVAEFEDGYTDEGFMYPWRFVSPLNEGVHRIAIEGINATMPVGATTNQAGVVFAMFTLDENGNDDTLHIRSDNNWVCKDYPAVAPGWTVGHMLRILLEEAQDEEECLLGWTLSFTDTLDSAGVAWPVDQQYSYKVGTDLLTVLRQLAGTDIDWVVDPDARVLHAYKIGTYGVAEGAETATLDSVSSLEFTGRG
jgi:hypothetical protein